ncbi:MAG: long-chain fatty acid--CoA ligase [Acidobacteriota bacterium]
MSRIWQEHYDPEVPTSINYPHTTLYDLLEQAAEEEGNRIATLFFGARIRYRKLSRLVDRLAAALASLGVKRGDQVALILPNLPLYPIAHFATMKLGAILVPTNPLYVERELEYQLNNAGVETAIIFDQLYPRLARVRSRTSVKRVVVGGVQDFLPPVLSILYRLKNKPALRADAADDVFQYRDLVRGAFPEVPTASIGPDDRAIFLYTGGTTGVSKGAVLTHRNLVVNVFQTRNWLWSMEDGKEVILCALPFFHSYGMTTGLHLAVQSRATMVLLPRFDLAEAVKRIKKHRPTIFCGVPALYNAINRSPKITRQDVHSIRLCVSGGAALPGQVQQRFEELTGGKLVEGYGLSETSPVAIVNPTHGVRKTGTIGVPIPDTDARIVDPQTRAPLEAGKVGELALKGPQVMKEYWNRPEETRSAIEGGWFYTGDLALMDEQGFFSIVDRKKDIIISAGMNVYPREVEEVLSQHPKVVEAAVLGVPSAVREETVKAYLVPEEGTEPSKAEIIQFCQDKLARYKIPKRIEFRKELPKTPIGKVLKRVLREEEEKRAAGVKRKKKP